MRTVNDVLGLIDIHGLYIDIFISQIFFHIATLSFMPLGNLQATGTKKYEITTIVLKSTNPYLPDRVEFNHQFV